MQSYKMAQERIVTYRGFQRKGLGSPHQIHTAVPSCFISRPFGKERSGRDLRMTDHPQYECSATAHFFCSLRQQYQADRNLQLTDYSNIQLAARATACALHQLHGLA